jgi:hypothetical protein
VLGAAAALAAPFIVVGLRFDALGRVSLAALPLVSAIWIVGWELMKRDWHDIDGWVDCYPYCHAWHRIGAAWFWGPPLAVTVLVLIAAAAGLRRVSAGGSRRGTRTRR